MKQEATAVGIDPKAPPDLTVEPVKPEEFARVEVYLEHVIQKELLPTYNQQSSALSKTENSLALNLACLKACVVGKGRGGKWEEYVRVKQFPVSLRTLDRWIEKALASGALSPWVIAKLHGNKRKTGALKKVRMSLPLEFDSETDRSILRDAAEKLGRAKLTQVILDAIREEMGL
jgi:hypothetical protein